MADQLYVVRMYDGFDYYWFDVTEPMSKEEAEAEWNKRTCNGTVKANYNHVDYYAVFPADTKMLYDKPRD